MYIHPIRNLRDHAALMLVLALAAIVTATILAANMIREPRAVAPLVPATSGKIATARERFAAHKQHQTEQAMDR